MNEKEAFRPLPGLSREAEERQLAEVIRIAQENFEKTEERTRKLSEELYDLMETYGPKDKEALALLHNTQSQMRENERDLVRCRKARKKPYFGRIDFRDPKVSHEESYYVGRVGIVKNGSEPVVIDWRAPVASVYYENALGPCTYAVKNVGTCRIDLKRKRTYEIAEDRLKDFFDSDVVANDELLNKYLAKSKKAVLGEIIATIQKEQNAIIRKSPKTNLIVQGVAGSGKTTVAMHRISYILYNYEKDFRPQDFYIIGSNRILLNYITGVLPDLDVYGVSQMTMEQLFVRLLYEDWEPAVHAIGPVDKKNPSACRKGSHEWFHDLERFCGEYERNAIPQREIRLENGVLLMEETAIRGCLEQNPLVSMQGKIRMLNRIVLAKLENEMLGKNVSYTPEKQKELQRTYRWCFGKDDWKGSVFEVYRDFLRTQEQSGKTVPIPENTFDVYDLAALAYLYKRIKETDGIREASHVIIDEAQDFGMMAYGALAYCLRGCTYTIMGDVSQNIYHGYGLGDWKELRELILTGPFDSFGLLKKSYRNTVEISEFATGILRHGNFSIYPVEPIIRHGKDVRVTECQDEAGMVRETVNIIEGWQRDGHETIAVICHDADEAARVSERLGESLVLADSNMETAEFGSGVMVLPVEYTKGLEFDAVLIYHPSAENYPVGDPYVKLLYVAATRALHELAVVHQGDLTDLIGKPVSGEKRMESLEETERPASGERRKRMLSPEPEQKDGSQSSGAGLIQASGIGETENEKMAGRRLTVLEHLDRERNVRGTVGKSLAGTPARNSMSGASGAPQKVPAQRDSAPVNLSPHKFGDCPDNSLLRPKGHSRIDNSVRIVRKTKKYLELISNYGTLRLTPVGEAMIRVQFIKGRMAEFEPGHWNYEPESPVAWTAREGKSLVEAATAKLVVRIDKKTGALLFFDKSGRLLLAEKAVLPRQIESAAAGETWVYFDWARNEKISAKGILADHLERMNNKARYISFGGRKLCMPLLVSDYGYGLGIAAEKTVLCCAIPMYGTYVHADETRQIDYYFLYGGDYQGTLELYKNL